MHSDYSHSIVAKLCTTEHQSCQEPVTLSIGHFFLKKVLDLCKNDLKCFYFLFKYIDPVSCIHR